METAAQLRIHVKIIQLTESKDGLNVRLAELERKWAQLNKRVNEELQLKRRLGPMVMKLKHDIGHHKRAAKVVVHKFERLKKEVLQTPINVAALERTLESALKVSARVSKELTKLNQHLDEMLAACGPLT
jgi:chromosome segregation ATPase